MKRAALYCFDLLLIAFWQVVLCLWLGLNSAVRFIRDHGGRDSR